MKIALVFAEPQTPHLTVHDGKLGKVAGAAVEILDAKLNPGAPATRVTVRTKQFGFTFFVRDVSSQWPIWIPQYKVAVVPANDRRTYQEIADDIRGRGLQSELDRIASEPEETFAHAAATNRADSCETWLGLSRDMRFFRVGSYPRDGYLGYFQAKNASCIAPQEGHPQGVEFGMMVGRGAACSINIRRRLEDGVLPILHAEQRDGDITYHMTTFCTLEKSPLTTKTLRGTHFLVADDLSGGHMHIEKDKVIVAANKEKETVGREEETVLLIRVEAVNTGTVPHYAFLTSVYPRTHCKQRPYDGRRGFGWIETGQVFSINRLNGKPMPQQEVAVLLQPGEKAVVESAMPHRFLAEDRAVALAKFDFEKRRQECRAFWEAKLAAAASIQVPEQRVNEMIRAGLLHLDMITYGLEPSGTTGATIGWYSPIGSESSPIIQFYDSVGWHKLAERSLQFFLDKQHENGFIQNFGGYMLETGGALWSMGEHYRYTRDEKWLHRVKPNLLKACEYLLAWRERNKTPQGMGLIEGKCADPEDPFRQFMLNGFAYVGMQRVAEMLGDKRLAREAAAWRADIRKVIELVMAESPVIPLGDGTWTPTCPAWAEARGPAALHVDGSTCNSHGATTCRDSLIGPLYLIIQEVIDAKEWMGECLLKSHHELFTLQNAGYSQPYYVRHDYAHIRRGEAAAFIKTYYNQFSALADRETYTFWEHYFGASPHKTHEEGWFLMQTRWMLWLEDGATLRLLTGVPRAWLEHGKEIKLEKVASHFGKFSLTVRSRVQDGRIEAEVKFHEVARKPGKVALRLPHPLGLKATACTGGQYDAATETVTVAGNGKVIVQF
ncbi:MAG: hypothetical protein PCFJNLEI_00879 [Verrucomicrobiae bacterium]|nr:hypothetical protein [Verrucomicrobiae bacterium]